MSGASRPGLVIWITGLSGSGKSTIANGVWQELRRRGTHAILLDGDAVREVFGGDLGHGHEDRLRNAFRISRLAKLLSEQGTNVVCATMSLFRECHDWNRANLPAYLEIYLRVPMSELEKRDPKGLYKRAAAGEAKGVVGVDLPFDEPSKAHLLIENAAPATPALTIAKVLDAADLLLR
jgi:cytidine diphosphoramidate kinase